MIRIKIIAIIRIIFMKNYNNILNRFTLQLVKYNDSTRCAGNGTIRIQTILMTSLYNSECRCSYTLGVTDQITVYFGNLVLHDPIL